LEEFPGIGERQSKRFVYFLLRRGGSYRDTLARSIKQLDQSVEQCTECYRFFSKRGSNLCVICENPSRDMSIVMIVEKTVMLTLLKKARCLKEDISSLEDLFRSLPKTRYDIFELKNL
jgi:recombinational DNA repair protein RecR